MNTESASFSTYGKSFQEDMCHLILSDRPFADQMSEVLDPRFLELKYLRVFIENILDYREQYGVHPTCKILTTIFRSGLEDENELIRKQVRDYFVRICNTEVEIDGSEYIKKTSLEFCKKQKLTEALLKCVPLLQSSSFDEISELINDALKLGSDTDHGYDYKADFEARFLKKVRDPITTGWDTVDEICKDGLGKGELGVVIAPTGAGKSMVLVHLGTQAVMAGRSVVHYTLELADTSIASRYDSCLTGVPLGDLSLFKEQIYEKVQDIEGSLIIKEYPTKSAGTNTIKAHLDKLKKRNIDIDMIIVDYGDLLRPNVVRKEKRHELETIYEDLRAIAQENKCPVWTASQTNRSGLNAEVVTMESISEAFNKCFVADFIFSLSRTVEDKAAKTARLFIAKNRNGPDGLIYPALMDTSNVKIKVLEQSDETIGELAARTAREQADELKKKYKRYREEGK
jgi:archaellum biogenesis ATPase FlaH